MVFFFLVLSIQQTKPLTGRAGELVKSFTEKISEINDRLKAENPEIVEKNVRSLVDEVEKLNEKLKVEGAVVSEKAQEFLKVIADNAVSTANQLKTQIEAAIAKKNWIINISIRTFKVFYFVYVRVYYAWKKYSICSQSWNKSNSDKLNEISEIWTTFTDCAAVAATLSRRPSFK